MVYAGFEPPNGRRGFVHKRLIRGIGGFLSGGPTGAIGGFIGPGNGGGGGFKRFDPCKAAGGWTDSSGRCRGDRGPNSPGNPIRFLNVGVGASPITSASGCGPGKTKGPLGLCVDFSAALPFGDPFITQGAAQVVMGRYGAAYVPASQMIDRAVCLPGDVVANDGLCYPKGKKGMVRQWPPGPRPLFTGAERKAVRIAKRVGTKMTNMAVSLQDAGLIKKPIARRRKKKG